MSGNRAVFDSNIIKFEMVNINAEIAEMVIDIREKRKIKLPNAIIAATPPENVLDPYIP